jgi:hypothetical protein
MRPNTALPSLRKIWRRLAACLIVALILVPLPAMALTFTSPWQALTFTSGGPTPPRPTFTDVTNGGQDDLFVNMGNFQGTTREALSVIGLERGISVPSAGEAISFAHAFATDLKQGGVDVAVAVFDSHGNLVAVPITFNQQTNSAAFTTISANQVATRSFNGGTYFLAVGIAYNTNNKLGGWNSKSVHHFEFLGL